MQDIRISLRDFLFSNPEKPLVTTGSGGAESVADFAALLYGARGGVGTAVSPPPGRPKSAFGKSLRVLYYR